MGTSKAPNQHILIPGIRVKIAVKIALPRDPYLISSGRLLLLSKITQQATKAKSQTLNKTGENEFIFIPLYAVIETYKKTFYF